VWLISVSLIANGKEGGNGKVKQERSLLLNPNVTTGHRVTPRSHRDSQRKLSKI
jgi:hypothetical protein